jgi:hypothetical protein
MFFDSPYPHASFVLDVVDKGVKVVAVMLGGAWTLMHYQRSRTYKVRLEPGVSGQMFCAGGESYLVIACTLKNVGLSKIDLNWPETWGEVHLMKVAGREKLRRFEVFRSHGWIESGELVTDAVVLPVPAPETYVALQLDLKVMSKETRPEDEIVWRAKSVLPSPDAVPTSPAQTAAAEPKPAPKGLLGFLRYLLQGG